MKHSVLPEPVTTDSECLLFVGQTEPVAPSLGTRGWNVESQPPAVGNFQWLAVGLAVLDPGRVQGAGKGIGCQIIAIDNRQQDG